MKTIQLSCAKCNGTMTVDKNKGSYFCPYCGASVLLVESDSVKTARIKYGAIRDVEFGSQKLQRDLENGRQKVQLSQARSKYMPFVIYAVFMALLIFSLELFGEIIPKMKGEIQAPSPSTAYVNKNYVNAAQQFRDAGFVDVQPIALGDLSNSLFRNRKAEVGKIKEVAIMGVTEFDSDNWFPKTAKVKIYYHTYPDKE